MEKWQTFLVSDTLLKKWFTLCLLTEFETLYIGIFYSPGQSNLQFSFCDNTQILCEIKFGNLRRNETVI